MRYDKQKLFEDAKKAIEENNLIFIEDVVAMLPIGKTSFYDYFALESNELNELKKLIETNKINLKVKMRKKWFESDSATLQMALMKLLSTQEEHKKLAQTFVETTEMKLPPAFGENPLDEVE